MTVFCVGIVKQHTSMTKIARKIMIFDKRGYIAAIESSCSFISIYTALFVLILCNIWFPYTLQNTVDKLDMVSTSQSVVVSVTSVSITDTLFINSMSQTTTLTSSTSPISTFTSVDTISLLKQDISKSVSQVGSVAMKQAHTYVNSTIYFLNETYFENKAFSDEKLENISEKVSSQLKQKSATIDEITNKINGSSVSVELGLDSDSSNSVNQTDLKNLKINYKQFNSLFADEKTYFDDRFNINSLVNFTKFNKFINSSTNHRLSLNSTQSNTIDLLLSGYYGTNSKSKRSSATTGSKSTKNRHHQAIIAMTVVFCLAYASGVVLYFMAKFLLKDKINNFILSKQSVTSTHKDISLSEKPHYNIKLRFIVNALTFLRFNRIIILFWTILIIEYCFVKYHTKISFSWDENTLTKRDNYFTERSSLQDFSITLNSNVESFITHNLFDSENGIIPAYIDDLGIKSDTLKSEIKNVLKTTCATLYTTSVELTEVTKKYSILSKRGSVFGLSQLENFYATAKNIILKYIRVLIIFASVFIFIQLVLFTLTIYHLT